MTIATAANPITVSAAYADKFKAVIADLVAAGFKGRVSCYARGGHVSGSLHYRGEACDFAQTAWNQTQRVMYHSRKIIVAHGLRDGCSFGDCGHVDSGHRLARVGRSVYASAWQPRNYAMVPSPFVERHAVR